MATAAEDGLLTLSALSFVGFVCSALGLGGLAFTDGTAAALATVLPWTTGGTAVLTVLLAGGYLLTVGMRRARERLGGLWPF